MRTRTSTPPEPLATMAKEYVELLETGEPNGWGQFVHEKYGVSHAMLHLMQVTYGAKETSDAVDRAFYAYHQSKAAPVT